MTVSSADAPTLPPLLRWAGSKRQQLAQLRALVPAFEGRYIEPFAGSACLYWDMNPKSAIISDLNLPLIDCYQCVADDPVSVYDNYAGFKNDSETYYSVREKFNEEQDRFARAGAFIYLNRYCFNGLYRTSKSGKFNVPYGGSRTGKMPTLDQIKAYAVRLSGVKLMCADFEKATDLAKEGDFVYLDPPFFTSHSRVFTQYTTPAFMKNDLQRLDLALQRIDASGALFVASYLDTPEIGEIASKWNEHNITALRRMSGFQSGRKRTEEVMFCNFDVMAA